MPVYDYRCSCGATKDNVVHKMAESGPTCECGQAMTKRPSAPALGGGDWLTHGVNGRYSKQAGRYFKNAKEVDAWASARGLAPVSAKSRDWRSIVDTNKEEANKDAKREGFRDQDDRKAKLADPKTKLDIGVANTQKQIDTYHAEHGSEGKKSVDEFAGLQKNTLSVTVP